ERPRHAVVRGHSANGTPRDPTTTAARLRRRSTGLSVFPCENYFDAPRPRCAGRLNTLQASGGREPPMDQEAHVPICLAEAPPLARSLPMNSDLIELVQNLGQPRVLVVGDVMLDRYVWGNAARISQEAPVILLQADRREERLGGASSVATLLRALGARPMLAGVVGADAGGRQPPIIAGGLGLVC